MADDNRLIEIMAELLAEARETRAATMRMAADIGTVKNDIAALKEQSAKSNAVTGELRLSVMRLAEKIEEIYHLDQRVRVLESLVLPKPPPLQAA